MRTDRRHFRTTAARAALAAALLGAAAAHAQTPSCEQFKAELTARITRSPGSFRVDALPSDAPLPAGGRVVGNCGGGQWKVVLVTGLTAAAAASAPTRPRLPASEAVAAKPVVVAAPAPPAPPTAPAASVARAQAAPTPAPSPAPAPTTERRTVASALPASAPGPVAAASIAAPVAPPASTADVAAPSFSRFASRPLAWLALGLFALLAIGLWRWIAHRMHYDAAGLPRGPRLN